MAEDNKQWRAAVITNEIISIVDDMVQFQTDNLCEDMKRRGHPPHYFRHLKLFSHRRAGVTTAALLLLEKYTSALIVTPSHVISNYYRRMAFDEGLTPTVEKYINDHLVAESTIDQQWIRNRTPQQRHQLIILDPASMIKTRRGIDGMDKLRHELFTIGDVLVELG